MGTHRKTIKAKSATWFYLTNTFAVAFGLLAFGIQWSTEMTPVSVFFIGLGVFIGINGWISHREELLGRANKFRHWRRAAWAIVTIGTVGWILYLFATVPTPHFQVVTRPFRNHPYEVGILIEDIPWKDSYREYLFGIESSKGSPELSNFQAEIYLPFPIIHLRFMSSPGCDGVSIFQGEGETMESIIVTDGRIVGTSKAGRNDLHIASTRMLPGAKVVVKVIVAGEPPGPPQMPPMAGWIFYGGSYSKFGRPTPYGMMARSIAPTDALAIGDEIPKADHIFEIPISWMFTTDPNRTVEIPEIYPPR